MRYFQFLIPLLTLPLLANPLDFWRHIANAEAAKTLDLAPARLVSEITLLILVLSFAATAAWIIRQRWTTYTVSIFYIFLGVFVMLGGPTVELLLRDDATVGPLVSDHMMTTSFDNLGGISWALLTALGILLLLLETFPPKKLATAG